MVFSAILKRVDLIILKWRSSGRENGACKKGVHTSRLLRNASGSFGSLSESLITQWSVSSEDDDEPPETRTRLNRSEGSAGAEVMSSPESEQLEEPESSSVPHENTNSTQGHIYTQENTNST